MGNIIIYNLFFCKIGKHLRLLVDWKYQQPVFVCVKCELKIKFQSYFGEKWVDLHTKVVNRKCFNMNSKYVCVINPIKNACSFEQTHDLAALLHMSADMSSLKDGAPL